MHWGLEEALRRARDDRVREAAQLALCRVFVVEMRRPLHGPDGVVLAGVVGAA